MSQAPHYYLIPATSGLCIQPTKDDIATAEINGEQIQQWLIERADANKVAFKNAGTGHYLRARGDYQGARVNQRPEKQYWVCEISNTPNAFWLKCDEGSTYLYNHIGSHKPNNPIFVSKPAKSSMPEMAWYIPACDDWKTSKGLEASSEFSSSEVQDRIREKERTLELKTAEMQKKLEEAEKREREALEFEQEARIKQEELAEKELELEAERKTMKKERVQQNGVARASGDDRHWSERFSRLQQRLEDAQKEIERLRVSSGTGDHDEVEDLRRELEAARKESRDSRGAYEALRESVDAGNTGPDGIKARRVHSATKEAEAASVGQRWAPPGFRAGRDSAVTTGDMIPITVKTEFSFLPRLR
ncbi:hypothetical protein CBER1_02581 [Cercospora berteroae]|uniref:Ricin B lectin domain-containing protein n=1 Tax=Cercospora berteroae TaxID=357750 RepID=A0A2S6CEL8_9PEZI|nr:hypothetical protein CBER1_02581 [Cercospora berteroae]